MPDFQNPGAFLLLILIPLLYIFRKYSLFSQPCIYTTISDFNGKSFEWNKKIRLVLSVISRICGSCAFFFVVLALADPVIYKTERIFTDRGTDIIFVLDVSPSMACRDMNGERRLDTAKQAITTLVSENPGVSYGLVTMAGEALVKVPPTLDHKLFLERLLSVSIGSLGDGTALGTGISTAIYHLCASSSPKKCIVLVTDGENNAGAIHPETASRFAEKNNITVYTLGLGTTGTVPLDYEDPESGKKYSGYLTSNFDSESLKQISKSGGGRFFEIKSLGDLSLALSVIGRTESTVQSYHSKTISIHYYEYLLVLSGIFISLCWIIRRIFLKEFI